MIQNLRAIQSRTLLRARRILRAMKPRLDACLDRINTAEQDFIALAAQMQTTLNPKDQAIGFRFKPEPNKDSVLVLLDRMVPIPPAWGRRVAYMLYDIRSALDHLIHELYVASNKRRPPLAIAEALAFPICLSEKAWTDASRQGGKKPGRLEGIDPCFVRVIRFHQPFRQFKTKHALWRLRTFNDLDKHRRPNIVAFAPADMWLQVDALPGCTFTDKDVEQFPLGRVLKVGTKLARVGFTPTGKPGGCVGVGLVGSLRPALERGVLLDSLITVLVAEARGIIGACQKLI